MIRLLLAVFLLTSVAACTRVVNPATGEVQYTTLSPDDEQRIGQQQHPAVLQEFGGAYDLPKLQNFVDGIGRELVAVSELKQQPFTFTVLDSPVVNAFALPGGYVYVTRGLLALAGDEAEVAGVLAHEIGHVTARHTAQQQTKAQTGQIAGVLGTLAGAILMGDAGAQLANQVASQAVPAWLSSYSRDQEFQADQLGVRYLTRAGYDPGAMASFLERLQADDQLRRAATGQTDDPADNLLASHPRTLDRIRQAAREAGSGGKRSPETYLAAVDGMRYGDDPTKGIVQGTSFVYPPARLRFDAPPGFHLDNTPQAVVGAGPGGAFMKFDEVARQTADVGSFMTRQWPGRQALRSLQTGTVADAPAGIGVMVGEVNGQPRQAVVGVVDAGNGKVWRFQFVDPRLTPGKIGIYRDAITSLRRMSATEAAAIKGDVIKVRTVRAGQTIASLLGNRQAQSFADQVRLINGLAPGAEPAPSTRIKLILPD